MGNGTTDINTCTSCTTYLDEARANPIQWDSTIILTDQTGQTYQLVNAAAEGTKKAATKKGHHMLLIIPREKRPDPRFYRLLLRLIDEFFPEHEIHVSGEPSLDDAKDAKDLLAKPEKYTYHGGTT